MKSQNPIPPRKNKMKTLKMTRRKLKTPRLQKNKTEK
jgi:hypothetical protein